MLDFNITFILFTIFFLFRFLRRRNKTISLQKTHQEPLYICHSSQFDNLQDNQPLDYYRDYFLESMPFLIQPLEQKYHGDFVRMASDLLNTKIERVQ